MLGPGIGIGVTDPKTPGGALLPEEEPAKARAVTKLQLEFTSGRVAARQAVQNLNHQLNTIPMAPDRSPIWPAGLVGSITHSDDICIAVVLHKTGADRVSTSKSNRAHHWLPTLNRLSAPHPSKIGWRRSPPCGVDNLARQVFCMKESIYKTPYPMTGQVIEFKEVKN